MLTVRDTVIFPGAMLPITVGRPASVALVQSLGENRIMAVVSQLDPRVDVPGPEDLYEIGTVCVMHKAIRVPKENLLLFCEGIARIRTREFTATRAVPEGARGAHCRSRTGGHARDRGPAAERDRPVPADRGGLAKPFGRPCHHRRARSPSRAAWPISWRATCRRWAIPSARSSSNRPMAPCACPKCTGISRASWSWSSCAGASNRRCRDSSPKASASSTCASN